MVVMTAALILGVIALVAAIVAWLTWHRGADERMSVQHHQHTLETLRHVADRRPPSSWSASVRRDGASRARPVTRPASVMGPAPGGKAEVDTGRPGKGASRLKKSATRGRQPAALSSPPDSAHVIGRSPPAPARAPRSSPGKESAKVEARRRETVVFADESPGALGGRSPSLSPPRPPGAQLPGSAAQARHDGRLRVRRTRLVAGAMVVALGAVGGGLALGHSSHPPRRTSHSHVVTAAGHSHVTIAPPSSANAATAPTPYGATYDAPSSSYTLDVETSAPCWVLATQASTKKVVWTGTIPAGGSQSLSVAGEVIVELGAPSDASVLLDGRALQLPTGYRAPFDLTVQPRS